MESSGPRPDDPEVPLADATIATEIARAAARGRGADRAPTLEQLLAAFGESEPTPEARRRVGAALRVAGMGVRPDLLDAEAGQRLMLLPPDAAGGPSRTRALLGLAGLAGVLVVAVLAATVLGGSDKRASDALPAGTETTAPAAAAAPATTATTPTSPTSGPTETTGTDTAAADPAPSDTTASDTTATATETTVTETTPTTTTPADEAATAAQGRRDRRAARERAARRDAAAARRPVTVRVDATARPSFVCADDGNGRVLFSGVLNGRQTFRGRRVRLNVGLASTQITVNGAPVRLPGSPAGLDITRRGGARLLASGQRPCA